MGADGKKKSEIEAQQDDPPTCYGEDLTPGRKNAKKVSEEEGVQTEGMGYLRRWQPRSPVNAQKKKKGFS